MTDEHKYPDGLEQQRQVLEAMSTQLTQKLQAMIAEQNQRAHDFNAIVPDYEHAYPEAEVEVMSVPYETIATPAPAPTPTYPTPPTPPPSPWAQQEPQPVYHTPPIAKKTTAKRRPKKVPAEQAKEEGSVSGVTITCIVIAVYLFIQCCS